MSEHQMQINVPLKTVPLDKDKERAGETELLNTDFFFLLLRRKPINFESQGQEVSMYKQWFYT